ncbi:MAG: helix-turn-helix domain-containing protein [Oligoflexus sp.]
MSIYQSSKETKVFYGPHKMSPVDHAVQFMIENYASSINLADIAQASGISKFKLIRRFHQSRHQTPMKWLWTYRLLRSIELMRSHPNLSIKQIAYLSGFINQSHYSRMFKQHFKIAPVFYRRHFIDGNPEGATLIASQEEQKNFSKLRDDIIFSALPAFA